MKIIVFGATGTVGRHIVDRALLQGHEVTAFARKAAAVTLSHPRLSVIEGDVMLAGGRPLRRCRARRGDRRARRRTKWDSPISWHQACC